MKAKKLFRLDSLRAIAVTLVLFFHLDILGFGFLGVDLFFVLSGFLMTHTMLAERQELGFFRVGAFFVRRFRRIVPSLLITIFVTCLIAFVIMSPEQLKDTAVQGLSAQFFLSNFLFFDQAGYFAPENDVRALLHTWSLSVEEQFYLLFGLILLASNRMRFEKLMLFNFIVAIAILLASYWAIYSKSTMFGFFAAPERVEAGVFYLTPFRLFQFLIGGMISIILHQFSIEGRTILYDIIGFSSIILGFVLVYSIPNIQIYTSLILAIAVVPVFLHNKLLEQIGKLKPVGLLSKISYQVYLVHWPIIVFWKYWTFKPLTHIETFILGLVSLVAGWALYELLNRLREPQLIRKTLKLSAIALFFSLAIQFTSYTSNGADWRVPESRKIASPKSQREGESAYCGGSNMLDGRELGSRSEDPLITCVREIKDAKTIYVLGDSHARHLLPGLSEYYPNHSIAVFYFTSCPAQSGLFGYEFIYKGRKAQATACVKRNQAALEFFKSTDPTTIIIHQYSGYESDNSSKWWEAARKHVATLKGYGHNVFWLGSVLYPGILQTDCFAVPKTYSNARLANRCVGDQENMKPVFLKNQKLKQEFPQTYVNVNGFFCRDSKFENCQTIFKGKPMFRDKHHITIETSINMIKYLASKVDLKITE